MDIYKTESEISALESEIEKYDERIAAVDEKLPQLEEVSDIKRNRPRGSTRPFQSRDHDCLG